MSDLHGDIMNIPCDPTRSPVGGVNAELAYKYGHRDARHAAAELASAHHAERAKPAEAEGVEVIAYATPNEDGDWQMLFFDEKEAIQYVDDEPPAPLVLQSAHIAALSAVTAERDRLLVDLERAHRATNSECMDWAREYERRKEVQAERDQLRAEVEMLRKDAERWRYVSLQGDDTHWLNLLRVDLEDFGGNINAAVDALIDGDTPATAAKEA